MKFIGMVMYCGGCIWLYRLVPWEVYTAIGCIVCGHLFWHHGK